MDQPFSSEGWPYGAAGGDPRQQPAGTGSFPFQGQAIPPTGAPAQQPPQTLPYPYPSYTTPVPPTGQVAAPAFVEQSYIENILRLNLGKQATVYCTFEGNNEWNAKTFTGTVEAAGRDHIIIEDEATTTRFLIPMVFVNYITFTGPLSYSYPFTPPQPGGRN
ncbi:MAG: spore coat protein GerQ [Sporolactobacillus sp.]|jgi:spore germination protein Q|nr:spore coat protein GerQ [Sporolactobacillus sp.]